jgi:hypothetical protein
MKRGQMRLILWFAAILLVGIFKGISGYRDGR